ncbi:UNVERIFIED_CONTAM: hypothetical protein FKN15_017102 [Acipenser sinensis]
MFGEWRTGLETELPHRRVTFSAANQAQDLQDSSQHNYYDSGLEESETPSSKSSSGPRIGPLALPEDHYERTTPDGSIGEMEHPENGKYCCCMGVEFREAAHRIGVVSFSEKAFQDA